MSDPTDLPPHPLANGWPMMAGDQYAAFRDDIKANGLRLPVWLFEGKVLDGRNRLRVCREVGITPQFVEFVGTQGEAAAFVLSVNYHRRHLTAEDRRALVEAWRAQGESIRTIARKIGASVGTVHADIASGVQNRTPDADAKVTTGKDGKTYPATKPITVVDAEDNDADDFDADEPTAADLEDIESGRDDEDDRDAEADSPAVIDDLPLPPVTPRADLPRLELALGYLSAGMRMLADEAPSTRHLRRLAWDGEPLWCPAEVGRKEVLVPWPLVKFARDARRALPGDDCPKCDGAGCKACRMAGYLPQDQSLLTVPDAGFGDGLGDITQEWGEG